MRARLVLVLPTGPQPDSYAGHIYTVEVLDEDERPERQLYGDFLTKARAWTAPGLLAQRRELDALVRRIRDRGTAGIQFRNADAAAAVPPYNSPDRFRHLPRDLRGHEDLLRGIPAVRLYCFPVRECIVLFDGNVKRTDAIQDEGSGVRQEWEEACAISRVLAKALEDQDIDFNVDGYWTCDISLLSAIE